MKKRSGEVLATIVKEKSKVENSIRERELSRKMWRI